MKTFSIKPTPDQLEAWQGAAARAGLSRHAWIRLVLDVAAGNSEAADQLARVRASGS